MKILVTGAAGFIGYSLCLRLLEAGHTVIGVDNLSNYYAVALKRKRLARLHVFERFTFHQLDLSEPEALLDLPGREDIERVVHLAAQAGVRYSMENPYPYVTSNVTGHLSALEFCRRQARPPLLIYASSSSVYGRGAVSPFHEQGTKGEPVSLYAVTKEADELMSKAYASLYGTRQIGVRLFTVYGPWGRPDMAYWLFVKKVLQGAPIDVFNHGQMRRDFTYIDDAVDGLMRVTLGDPAWQDDGPPHRLFNLGTGQAESLEKLIEAVSNATGKPARLNYLPMQAGDVQNTCADINQIAQAYGYKPKIALEEGIARFVEWFMSDDDLMTY